MYERFGTAHLIQEPDVPEDGTHIWDWFWSLSNRRQQGMEAPQPLEYGEIGKWMRMTGEQVLREELSILTDMDDAYLTALAKERQAQRASNEKK